jgi:hypothetical protein
MHLGKGRRYLPSVVTIPRILSLFPIRNVWKLNDRAAGLKTKRFTDRVKGETKAFSFFSRRPIPLEEEKPHKKIPAIGRGIKNDR